MLAWVSASLAFFIYVALMAAVVRGLAPRRRVLAASGSLVGVLIALAAHYSTYSPALHEWIVPPVLLLLAYWSSGLMFARPMPRAERVLEGLDRALAIDRVAASLPRWLAELLESAYAGVYPLVLIAFVIHRLFAAAPDAERFWTIILVTDFVCFAFLPWIQTRPPRAFRTADPWVSRVRRLNLRLLGTASIQVNTFPSGHAAEALAAVLLVLGAPSPVLVSVAVAAVLVSVGAVLGRYHYAADAWSGWTVAAAVWIVV